MSVFAGDVFPVRIRYKPIIAENGAVIGANILPSNAEEGEEIVCVATTGDYDTMSSILEESTIINHITGAPMIRPRQFNKLVITRFFKSWNLVTPEGSPIPINATTINKMFYNLVRALVAEWRKAQRG